MTQQDADRIRQSEDYSTPGYGTLARLFNCHPERIREVLLGRTFNRDGLYPRKLYSTYEKDVRKSDNGMNYPTLTQEEYDARNVV